jgi:hypothetical protein
MWKSLFALCLLVILSANTLQARQWSDASGNYQIEANLIAFDNTNLVLQKTDKTLVSVKLEQLSEADQKYLTSAEAAATLDKLEKKQQTWTMRSGLTVVGKVVDYVRRDVTVRMFRGKIYVNDHHLENLPDVYKVVVPKIVAEFTGRDIDGEKGLRDWLKRRKGEPETFTCDGVLMELTSGDLYAVPFFLFDDKALQALKPGWDRWLASASNTAARQETALQLESQARLYQEDTDSTTQMLKLQLQLQGYNAGLFSLWEVVLYPNRGTYGQPLWVVVPGRDSRQAGIAALESNPGYSLGPISKVQRQY